MLKIEERYLFARKFHDSGQLAEAKQAYEEVLNLSPSHPDALHWYGILAAQCNQLDIAIDLVSRSVKSKPNQADYWSNLGMLLSTRMQFDQAAEACKKSIELNPVVPESHNNLGNALWGLNQIDAAIKCYQTAIELRPNFAQAHYNIANGYRILKNYPKAITSFLKALELQPTYPEALCNLGLAYKDNNSLNQAAASFQKALQLQPNYLEAIINLGSTYAELKEMDRAIEQLQKAIRLSPNSADVYCTLGKLYFEKELPLLAIEAYQNAIQVKPYLAEAYNDLGNVYKEMWMPDEAIECYRKALSFSPKTPKFTSNLGNALKDIASFDESIATLSKAIQLDPALVDTHDVLLMTMNYDPRSTSESILVECRKWDKLHAEPLKTKIIPHANNLHPNKRLRIGYVSADFRNHPVGRFLLPIFKNHDRKNFEIFCYSNHTKEDQFTDKIRSSIDNWRPIHTLSNDEAADLIRNDQIDILVDLSLHTAGNRLLVFAQKPAPIQVTYAGYPGTTGLSTIDYRLTDPHLDPEGSDSFYSENSIRIPSFWCYDSASNDLPVSELPATKNGYITFGSLHNFCKINPEVIDLWGNVLSQIKTARLVMLAPPGSSRNRVIERLARFGVEACRIDFFNRMPHEDYLNAYHYIDISLDTFPYNGHTTSLDSLWMGVPVVTLVGKTIVGRGGLSQLINLSIPELIAETEPQFVQIAASLASDPDRLSKLRNELRQRMKNSTLMDAVSLVSGIEDAFRLIWHRYCV